MISVDILEDFKRVMTTTPFAKTSDHTFKLRRKLIRPSKIRWNGLAWQLAMLLVLLNSQVTAQSKNIALRFGRLALTVFLILPVIQAREFAASLTLLKQERNDNALVNLLSNGYLIYVKHFT